MAGSVLTVSQVSFYIKSLLEGDSRLRDVLVSGEVSNFTDHYRSGHLYFSLKDEKSVLKAVMFAGSAKRLKFRPQDGMKVLVRGRISSYEASGQYQLYAEDIQPDGVGALSLAFEQLKAKLEREGLFDPGRKRPLPRYPGRIGVITSPTGAAVRDILQITGRRWPLAEIIFAPVLVQGEGAPPQMIGALEEMNRKRACDVILLGRGGGSLEDLWAFNDEGVARAVASSQIPVVSAVGHETDFTICDFAADLRAATPSAAAELATPDFREERRRLIAFSRYFHEKAEKTVEYFRQSLDLLAQDSFLGRPELFLKDRKRELGVLFGGLTGCFADKLEAEQGRLALLSGTLDAVSPLKVLSRGYAMVMDEEGKAVRDAASLSPGDRVSLRLAAGRVEAEILRVQKERKS